MTRKALSSPIVALVTVIDLLVMVGGLWAYVFASHGDARRDVMQTPRSSSSSSTTSAEGGEPTWSLRDAPSGP